MSHSKRPSERAIAVALLATSSMSSMGAMGCASLFPQTPHAAPETGASASADLVLSGKALPASPAPLVAAAANIPSEAELTLKNPGAESGGKAPEAWMLSPRAKKGYDLSRTTDQAHGGESSAKLRARGARGGYGSVLQAIDAREVSGKRVRASVWVRTESTGKKAQFWVRAHGADKRSVMKGGQATETLEATSDWKLHELVLDVPAGARSLDVGFGLANGALWFDDASLTVETK